MGVKSVRKYSDNEYIFGKHNKLMIINSSTHCDSNGNAVYTVLNTTTNKIYYGITNSDIKRIAESDKEPLVIHVDGDYHTLVDWNKLLGLDRHTLQMYYKRHNKDRKAVEDHIRDLLSRKKGNEE